MTVMREILTTEFFSMVANTFGDMGDSDSIYSTVGEWIQNMKKPLSVNANVKYGDVPVLDEYNDFTEQEIAQAVTISIADGFVRIFYTLLKEYNPYENYFTERTMSTDTDRDKTKNGKIVTTPKGEVINELGGTKVREYDDHSNVGQGTTFESYGDDDFKNVSKNIVTGKIKDRYQNYGSTTRFNQYSVEQNFDNVEEEETGNETVTEKRNGSSGIFSKQELFKREISNRMNYRLMPILLAMIVSELESGVYYAS